MMDMRTIEGNQGIKHRATLRRCAGSSTKPRRLMAWCKHDAKNGLNLAIETPQSSRNQTASDPHGPRNRMNRARKQTSTKSWGFTENPTSANARAQVNQCRRILQECAFDCGRQFGQRSGHDCINAIGSCQLGEIRVLAPERIRRNAIANH